MRSSISGRRDDDRRVKVEEGKRGECGINQLHCKGVRNHRDNNNMRPLLITHNVVYSK